MDCIKRLADASRRYAIPIYDTLPPAMSKRPTSDPSSIALVAPLHDALDELAGALPTPILKAATLCLAGLRVVSISVPAIVVFVGLFVIVGNVPS